MLDHHRRNAMRIVYVLVILLTGAAPAQAYVDPGTGMLAIQGLIALVIGIVAFVRHPIQTVRDWIARWRHRKDGDA
jgi:prepilin signal peptidase PulO-like enzyme (type II secretory pathway)